MEVVRRVYGPTLPELLGARRWRRLRTALALAAVAAAAVALWPSSATKLVVGRGVLEFNFIFSAPLRQAGAASVEERRGATFVQSMSVGTLRLPRYDGDVGGALPIVADRLARELSARYAEFEVVGEGRARINENPGYVLIWQARERGRRIFARDYLLVPEEEPGTRLGAHLELRATYAAGVASALDVGDSGPLKRPLRSFRFGTERP